jgi:hypothetical protein
MGILGLLSGGSSVFILGRTVLMATVAVETAQCLFHGMIKSVFKAPVSFFDTTPSSQILSRVSFTSILYPIILLLSVLFKLQFCFLWLLVIYGSKYSRYKLTLLISWTSLCTIPVITTFHFLNSRNLIILFLHIY